MVLKVAIVEDNERQRQRLKGFVEQYAMEQSISPEITLFSDGEEILSDYKACWDLILMDIEMPHVDGMQAAKKIRLLDDHVFLIFVTAMAQYAIRGYEVDALDFMIKPVNYPAFSMKLRKVINMLKVREQKYILINSQSGACRLFLCPLQQRLSGQSGPCGSN